MLGKFIWEWLERLLFIISIALLFSVFLLTLALSRISAYQSFVNYTLERNGGITEEALADIEDYTTDFITTGTIEFVPGTTLGKQPYGTEIKYNVRYNYVLAPFDFIIPLNFTGTAVSLVK